MREIPKGYEEIFAELDREYEEEQQELVEEYKGEICKMVNKISSTAILDYIHVIVGDILKEEEGVACE